MATREIIGQHPEPTEEQIQEAAKLREQARESGRKSQESFDRCDTDGFLSQWALDLMASKLRAQAEILEQGGYDTFEALSANGTILDARIIETQYGHCWLLSDDDAARYGRRFIPLGSKSRVQKSLGMEEVLVWKPAKAIISGRGTGLSGTAFVKVIEDTENSGN